MIHLIKIVRLVVWQRKSNVEQVYVIAPRKVNRGPWVLFQFFKNILLTTLKPMYILKI